MKIRMLERKNRVLLTSRSQFSSSKFLQHHFRIDALFHLLIALHSQKLFIWYRMLLLNIYVTDLMQTCYIHVQQYQIITFAVYRGRLLLARSHFHADHAGWP